MDSVGNIAKRTEAELNKNRSVNSFKDKKTKPVPVDVVDQLGDDLVREFNNPQFRSWYCKAIMELGPSKIHELRTRAKDGSNPAKYFSLLVKQCLQSMRN